MSEHARTPPLPGFDLSTVRRRALMSAAATVLALIIGALVYLVAATNDERDAAAERERTSFEVIMLTRNIERSIARSEAALGRFVINSDRALGTVYRDEWRAAGRQVSHLGQMVRDDQSEAARIETLETHFENYGEELAHTASYAAAGRNWEALSLHNTAASSADEPEIDRLLEEIAEQERFLLGERSNARQSATERSNLLADLLAIAGVLLALAAAGLAWATIRAWRERETAYLRADDLEAAVAERTAELEALNAELVEEGRERAAAEGRLRQAQKLKAVGQLTGGIAHDFNNMLAVVIGALELAKRRLDRSPADVERHIDNALDGATRAAELTRRLLAFARAEPLRPEGVDAAGALENMASLLRRSLGERIGVAVEAEPDLWPIWADRPQFENAILNLAVNARDAMDGKGEVEIRLANVTLGDDEIGEAAAGDYIRVAVTDSGSGMSPQVIERVFEPFFTTKPVGKGTGLGLSQIFGFVRESGGEIAIDSTVGEGTTVSLYLPRFDGDAAKVDDGSNAHERRISGNGPRHLVLLVEDDDRVRRATGLALEELGHEVIACASGAAALEVFCERRDIDLLVTDVVMPEMTGPELASRLRENRPELPLLFVTGFAGEAEQFADFAADEVLRKPFTLSQLSLSLDHVMRDSEVREEAAE